MARTHSNLETAPATRFTVIRHRHDLPAVREPWRQLREVADASTPDADPDRFARAIGTMDAMVQPCVTFIGGTSRPRAIIAGRVSTRRIPLRVGYMTIRTPPLRCLDIPYGGVVLRDPEDAVLVQGALTDMLSRDRLDLITLGRLGVDDPLSRILRSDTQLRRRLIPCGPETHWQLELIKNDPQRTLGRLSRKHRYNLRRSDRLLVEHFDNDVHLRSFSSPEDVDRFLDGADAITQHSYQSALGVGLSNIDHWRDVLHAEAAGGHFLGYWLECAGRPVAFQLGLVHDETYYLQATAFLPEHARHSPGQVLLVRVIADLCRRHVQCLDYGFGDADYKKQLGSRSWHEETLHLYGPGLRARATGCAVSAATRLHTSANHWLDRAGLQRIIKRAWRQRLARTSSTRDST